MSYVFQSISTELSQHQKSGFSEKGEKSTTGHKEMSAEAAAKEDSQAPAVADPYARRLPDYFPLIARGCEMPSVHFFKCFGVEAEQDIQHLDARAGDRALVRCRRELDAYEACMNSRLSKKSG